MLIKFRQLLRHSVLIDKVKLSTSLQARNCTMSSLTSIVEKLNGFAPEKYAETWDNVGLLIEPATPK